jgi:hypothetical protein
LFWWKCQICKEPIKSDLIERWMDKRKFRYHRRCIEKQEYYEREANKILRKVGGKH